MPRPLLVLALCLLVAAPAFAGKPEAARLVADGKALLAKGDLEGAYRAHLGAVKADPTDPELSQQALLLRRVIQLRAHVARADPSPAWEKQVTSLHHWYVRNGLLEMAVEQDRAAHARAPGLQTGGLLADALLRTDRNAEAEKTLAALPVDELPVPHRLFLGIALARQGKKDAARERLAGLDASKIESPALQLMLARVHVLLGDVDRGLGHLRTCLEKAPPSAHQTVKADVKGCGDFASVRTTKAFTAALATKSKVAESDCSSGSDCGSCPSRKASGGG
jgi:hypothetical protein